MNTRDDPAWAQYYRDKDRDGRSDHYVTCLRLDDIRKYESDPSTLRFRSLMVAAIMKDYDDELIFQLNQFPLVLSK